MSEQRTEPRLRSLLGARINFNRRRSTMDCIVRNISPHGAMVVFPQTTMTPRHFHIDIPARDETHCAQVVWREHDRIGVSLSPMELFEVPIDAARTLRRLLAENRRLRSQLDRSGW